MLMSRVPQWCSQGSVLRPALFIIFVSDTDSGIECTFSEFIDKTKMSDAVNIQEGRNAIQRDLDIWAHVNLMKYDRTECKVLNLG